VIVNHKLERIGKGAVVVDFDIMFRYFTGGTGNNYENPGSRCVLRVEIRTQDLSKTKQVSG